MSSQDNRTSEQASAENASPAKRPTIVQRGIQCFRVCVIVYVLVLIAMVVFESRLVYPGAYFTHRNAAVLPEVEDWDYRNKDDLKLTGRKLLRPDAKRTVLLLHGNGIQAKWMDLRISQLANLLQCDVYCAEYSGFQYSEITPCEENFLADACSAHQAACQDAGVQRQDLVVYGTSLGGAAVAEVASINQSKTIILDRTFDAAVAVAAQKYWMMPVRWLMQNRFESQRRLSEFQGKVVQIHGPPDAIVPYRNGKALFDSIPSEDKNFLTVEGLGHNDSMPNEVLRQVEALLPESNVPESSVPESSVPALEGSSAAGE
ncbi:Alpha/beta hydrolase family protein [Stieleria bergensis]|uniref:Alpha/beta hydrolase family protein n=1 Tax=Stieleria bergensis TaxID=2528025 RepID=A0A517SQ84_9BACT|nr:Alpha/beta hydrolase family protein [Planctomycetes bacterium SV_7m_r]